MGVVAGGVVGSEVVVAFEESEDALVEAGVVAFEDTIAAGEDWGAGVVVLTAVGATVEPDPPWGPADEDSALASAGAGVLSPLLPSGDGSASKGAVVEDRSSSLSRCTLAGTRVVVFPPPVPLSWFFSVFAASSPGLTADAGTDGGASVSLVLSPVAARVSFPFVPPAARVSFSCEDVLTGKCGPACRYWLAALSCGFSSPPAFRRGQSSDDSSRTSLPNALRPNELLVTGV